LLRGEVFADVRPALERWQANGRDAGIFSSGSVLAQKLLFRHSSSGDLTGLLRWYFDTAVGPKTDAESYHRIASAIGVAPVRLLFVSDTISELDAARQAQWATVLSRRPGNRPPAAAHDHPVIDSFDELY
jgi:enolase-phosphatase E1